MSEPEIARRCPACGASVRGRASFCPHCGTPLQRDAVSANPLSNTDTTTSTRDASAIESMEPPMRRREDQKSKPSAPQENTSATNAASPARDDFATRELDEHKVLGEKVNNREVASGNNATGGKRRRVVTAGAVAARERVEENLRPHVEKLRQASSSVLDEAADDPGARFVLVAVAFFLLTLLLIIISKMLG